MVRAANVDDVRRCVEFAGKRSVPIAIRGSGHSYAGYGVADGALQIDLGTLNAVNVDCNHRGCWRTQSSAMHSATVTLAESAAAEIPRG